MKNLKVNKFDMFINQVIQENTEKMKVERNLLDNMQEIIDNNKKSFTAYQNKMPYIFCGLVESVFINEHQMQKVKEFGCGIVIDKNLVIVPAKNLVFDDRNLQTSTDNLNKEASSSFELFDVNFTLLNISDEYRKFLPKILKVKDFYTPLNSDSKETTDEERIINGWGLILLEYPIGDFLQYIIEEETAKQVKKLRYKSKSIIDFSYIKIKNLDNKEVETSEILFLECKKNSNQLTQIPETGNEMSNSETVDTYSFVENVYDMKFDENIIFLFDTDKESSVLPGPILAYHNRNYYLLGFNSNIVINLNEQTEDIHRIALRFNKSINTLLLENISTLNTKNESFVFLIEVFRYLVTKIKKKSQLESLLRQNCKELKALLLSILNEKKVKIYEYEKSEIDIASGFIRFAMMLIWNKLSTVLEGNIINFDSCDIGVNGCEILSEILMNCDYIQSLNLRSNNIFGQGLKTLIKPIFNTKQIIYLARDLKIIELDFNKLGTKAMKHLRHLLKLTLNLEVLSLNNNYIEGSGMRHMINALKGKENLTILNLSFNMIETKGCIYMRDFLGDLPKLREFNLDSNNISDEGCEIILSTFKEKSVPLQRLSLSNNNITMASGQHLLEFLSNHTTLRTLCLSNNNFSGKGFQYIASGLANNYVLDELKLNSTECGPEEMEDLAEGLKHNNTLRKISLNSNYIGDVGIVALSEYLKENNNLRNIYLANNNITDQGAVVLAEALLAHQRIVELKINSNYITDEGARQVIFALIQCNSLQKFNIENNLTSWIEVNVNLGKV